MVTKDYLFGFATALLAFSIIEAISLWVALRENKKLKIDKISEDANAIVEKMDDSELKSKLDSDLNSKS